MEKENKVKMPPISAKEFIKRHGRLHQGRRPTMYPLKLG